MARIPLTEEIIVELKAEQERTGVRPPTVVKLMGPGAPTDRTLYSWINKETRYVDPEKLYMVLGVWRALPDNPSVPITKEIHARLVAERERTGIGSTNLFKQSSEPPPEGLTSGVVETWVQKRTKKALQSHLDYVFAEYATWGPVTSEDVTIIQEEMERTGLNVVTTARLIEEKKIDGPSHTLLGRWLRGTAPTPKRKKVENLLRFLQSVPDGYVKTEKKETKRPGYQPLTKELTEELTRELDRIAMKPSPFLNLLYTEWGLRLDLGVFKRWLEGTAKLVKKRHLYEVLGYLKNLPDGYGGGDKTYIPLTPEMLAGIRRHKERSGAGPTKLAGLLRQFGVNLTPSRVHHILAGKSQTVRKGEIQPLLKILEDLPDKTPPKPKKQSISGGHRVKRRSTNPGYTKIPEQKIQEMRDHKERTGISAEKLLKFALGKPEFLDYHMVNNWIAGKTKTALPEWVDYVLNLWEARPPKK